LPPENIFENEYRKNRAYSAYRRDWITKNIAKQNLQQHEIIHLPGDTIRLQYADNAGAFLSLGRSWNRQLTGKLGLF
jgi:hypothetical protein